MAEQNRNRDSEIWEQINSAETEVNEKNGIRQSNLLELLRQVTESKNSGGALRTAEICEITGWSDKRVRKQLGVLKSRGLIEVITVDVIAVDDTMRPGKAYRLVENETG